MSIPASTVISIAVLSHVLGKDQLAVIAAIFGVSFVGTVLPIGIQARTAADAAHYGSAASVRWRPIFIGTAIWVALSPFLAYALHMPVLAMLSPALGLIPSMAVGVGRGEMIGQERFVEAGANHLVESSIRLAGGIGLGILLGVNGAALTLFLCQVGAWALLPRRLDVAPGSIRLPSAFATTAMVILGIQVDLLLAPRLLGADASVYAASALPAKAVYLALAATAWLVVPGAVKCRRLTQALAPFGLVVAAGLVLSGILAVAAPLIGALLGQSAPNRALVLALGCGMALASGNWILVQIQMAKAPRRQWLAPATAVAVTVIVAAALRSDLGFCLGIFVGQACATTVSLVQLHFGLRHDELVDAGRASYGSEPRDDVPMSLPEAP
jgi:hypothetical protein